MQAGIQRLDRRAQIEPGANRQLGVMLVRIRVAEIGEDRITDAPSDRTITAAERVGQAALEGTDDLAQFLGVSARRRPHEFARHHRQLAPFGLRLWRRLGSGRRRGCHGGRIMVEWRDRADEPVAASGKGFDPLRTAFLRAEDAAQRGNLDGQVALLDRQPRPCRLDQLILGDRHTRPLHQCAQQGHGTLAEHDGIGAAKKDVRLRVNSEWADRVSRHHPAI